RRQHTSFSRDWSSDVCSSDLNPEQVFVIPKLEIVDLGRSATWRHAADRPRSTISSFGITKTCSGFRFYLVGLASFDGILSTRREIGRASWRERLEPKMMSDSS